MPSIKHVEIRNVKEGMTENRSSNNDPCSSWSCLVNSTLKTTLELTWFHVAHENRSAWRACPTTLPHHIDSLPWQAKPQSQSSP